MFSRMPWPGLAVAAYPQRDGALFPSRFESMARSLANVAARPFGALRFRPDKIVSHVEKMSRQTACLEDGSIEDYAAGLRYQLKRDGLNEVLAGCAFALIREVAGRTIGMRHYPSQLMGGWVMLNGKIAEMETGEGKTLTATLPACTVAFMGLPVHIITVNDYLAERDARLMEPVYKALGISVGVVTESMDNGERRKAYACEVTYCTNKQIVFDYLRDRLALGPNTGSLRIRSKSLLPGKHREDLLMRGLCYAIVDEADSVLVDEAVTPLIISKMNQGADVGEVYAKALELAGELVEGVDFILEDSGYLRNLRLTEQGSSRARQLAESSDGKWKIRRYRDEMLVQALKAKHLFVRDVHYLVDEGKVKIIDEFTGRLMADRSWQRGLHQLIETKEGCQLSGQRETIGQISYQAFFRRYMSLSGMSGTVKEIAAELKSVYDIDVVKMKTHKPLRRRVFPDSVYFTEQQKLQAVLSRINTLHRQGRPVLVGTRSVEASEKLSEILSGEMLPHRVLNARQNRDEAEIIAEAGQLGRITVATNMAGRGTDICLAPGVADLGGLHVIATERHASRRIDRQLFGRCARQGDPGSCEMIIAYDDELMVNFGLILIRPKTFEIFRDKFCPFFLKTILDRSLFSIAQKRAEINGARLRRAVLKMEDYVSNALAFSGRLE